MTFPYLANVLCVTKLKRGGVTYLTISGQNGKWCHLSCFLCTSQLSVRLISDTKNVLTGYTSCCKGCVTGNTRKDRRHRHSTNVSLRYHAGLQSWYCVPLLWHNPHDPIISLSFYVVALLFAQLATRGLGDWQFHSWQILRCLTVWFLWDSVSECFGPRQGKDCDTSLSAGLSVKALQRAGNWAASDFRLLYIYMWLIPTS